MKNLYIDIETYCDRDLSRVGLYKYTESPNFEILLFGYAIDSEEVKVVDLAQGEKMPQEIIDLLTDDTCLKWAHNASFERVCLSRFLGLPKGEYLSAKAWRCSMILSLYNGLPASLKQVGEALSLDKKKLEEGKDLIKYFCVPCKPTKTNGERHRNYYYHDKEKWELFKFYNKRDVETEIEIINKLIKFNAPDFVWDEYAIDQEINDRGILVDIVLAKNAIELDKNVKDELMKELETLTGLENPNSVAQQKSWLSTQGLEASSLGKKEVEKYAKSYVNTNVGRMLEIRQMISKSSVKKYEAMLNYVCHDNRARGMFKFYSCRTGRFASAGIQLQNLPRNELSDLDVARDLVKFGPKQAVTALYDNIPDTLSQLIRTAFIAQNKAKFVVADYSAIEARVLAWLAGEQWRIDMFARGGDIYCESASQMFKVPVVKHGINGHLRAKGKVAELSCGYGGSVGALKNMGALDMGLTEEELPEIIEKWRTSNPHIVAYWKRVENAAFKAIDDEHKITHETVWVGKVGFRYQSGMLFILLPSGRRITYVKPREGINRFGTRSLLFEGLDMTKKFTTIETYGGKLVENITQAVARDLLVNAMKRLRDYRIVASVHDELIIETPLETSVDFICKEMATGPEWAKGLPLKADGYETKYYKKD